MGQPEVIERPQSRSGSRAEYQRAYRARNLEKIRAYDRARYQLDKEKKLLQMRNFAKKNPEKIIKKNKDYYLRNKERKKEYQRNYHTMYPEKGKIWCSKNIEKIRINDKKRRQSRNYKDWRNRNRHKTASYTQIYRVKKCSAIPSWTDKDAVNDIYLEAKYQGMEVDHVIPLQSKLVCGLHWEGNLQLLTKQENSSKGNRFHG